MALADTFGTDEFPECCGIIIATGIFRDNNDGCAWPESDDIAEALDEIDGRKRVAFDMFVLNENQFEGHRQLIKDRGYTISYPGRNPNTGRLIYICFRNNYPVTESKTTGIISGT